MCGTRCCSYRPFARFHSIAIVSSIQWRVRPNQLWKVTIELVPMPAAAFTEAERRDPRLKVGVEGRFYYQHLTTSLLCRRPRVRPKSLDRWGKKHFLKHFVPVGCKISSRDHLIIGSQYSERQYYQRIWFQLWVRAINKPQSSSNNWMGLKTYGLRAPGVGSNWKWK